MSFAGIIKFCAVAGSGGTVNAPSAVVNITLLFVKDEISFADERKSPPQTSSAYKITEPAGKFKVARGPFCE